MVLVFLFFGIAFFAFVRTGFFGSVYLFSDVGIVGYSDSRSCVFVPRKTCKVSRGYFIEYGLPS